MHTRTYQLYNYGSLNSDDYYGLYYIIYKLISIVVKLLGYHVSMRILTTFTKYSGTTTAHTYTCCTPCYAMKF